MILKLSFPFASTQDDDDDGGKSGNLTLNNESSACRAIFPPQCFPRCRLRSRLFLTIIFATTRKVVQSLAIFWAAIATTTLPIVASEAT